MIYQLPLALNWPNHSTFDSFHSADNAAVLACLKNIWQADGETCVYLHGTSGSGLSHLLYAVCHAAQQQAKTAIYLPLQKARLAPQVLDGVENLSLICWDDVESIAGNRLWEEALFHCYNRAQAMGVRLLIASHFPPTQISWSLADLGSRLSASMVLAVQALSDQHKREVLQERAKRRGLHLPDEVGRYLLTHCSRDMRELFSMLERLDKGSLAAQRRLTIPFVKLLLGV